MRVTSLWAMPLEEWGPAPFTEPDGLQHFPPPASVCWDEVSNANHIGPGSYYRRLGDKLWDCCGVSSGFACHLSGEKPHATLGENTEVYACGSHPLLSRWRNECKRFDWTGDSQQIKVKFTTQAEFECRLAGFQSIALIWLSYSEAMNSFWFQVFISIWVRKRG